MNSQKAKKSNPALRDSENREATTSEQNISPQTNFNLKKYLRPLLFLGLVLVIVVGLLIERDIIGFGRFKAITYDNGKGSKIKLEFYRQHYASADFTTITPKDLSTLKNSSVLGLASKVSTNNKYPVWFSISTDKTIKNTQGTYYKDKKVGCGPLPTVFEVKNNYIGQTIAICDFKVTKFRAMYSGVFTYKNNSYDIIITQVASEKDMANPANSDRLGLKDYSVDLKEIVGSIKPL